MAREHARLAVALHRLAGQLLKPLFSAEDIRRDRLPVVAAVGGDFVAGVDDAPDYVGRILGEVDRTEEGGLDPVAVKDVKNLFGAVAGDLHPLGEGELNPAFPRHIEFFGVETKQYHLQRQNYIFLG